MTINRIRAALNAAVRAAAQSIGGKNFSRKSALTAEKVIVNAYAKTGHALPIVA